MSADRPGPGSIIDGTYRLDAVLGEGGSGIVFRAVHLGLQKPVAVKVLQPPQGAAADFFERFRVEAEALGRLAHPGIVRVTDFGVDPRGDGLPYLVMELVEGTTLDAWCASGPVALERATPVLETIAEALDAAHHAGIVHGDLKLRNVMLTSYAQGDYPVVIDFGLAHIIHQDSERATAASACLRGTAEYMAPELSRGASPSPASDVYAFGILAYRMITGRYPFTGTRTVVLDAHTAATPTAPSGIVSGLTRAIDQALLPPLAKRPIDRPGNAVAVARALRRTERQLAHRAWRRRELPRRAAAAILIGLFCAVLQSVLGATGLLRRLESLTLDSRVRWSSPRPMDDRLLLVSFDDRSLAADDTPLPDRADEVGNTISRLMAAGAGIVGVDLLLPAHWAESRAFADLVLRHAPRLALAIAQEGDTLVGPESVGGLISGALGREATASLFASVNVEPDLDGIVRSARLSRTTENGGLQPTMAARMADWRGRGRAAGANGRFPIDYRLDRLSVERISWIDLGSQIDTAPDRFRDRLVLVGAEFSGSGDRHLAPRPGGPPSDITGLEQQAIIAATLLAPDALSVPDGRGRGLVLAWLALCTASVAFVALLRVGAVWPFATLAAAAAVWAAGSIAAFAAGLVVPVAAPLAGLLLGFVLAWTWSGRWSVVPPRLATPGTGAPVVD